ncbi:MAG: transglutaminase domain-containing protein [Spirochaetales bacterium]|nr:transglutaminase domain-containing protein [Spirochaetales bacterium]
MPIKFKSGRKTALFLLRNTVLYYLLFNVFLQVSDIVDIGFLSGAFILAIALAVWFEKTKLRLLPALIVIALVPILLRIVSFIFFSTGQNISPGISSDFLFFNFDKNFYPSLVPFLTVWLFNFLALRYKTFPFAEVGVNSIILILVFWRQAHFRIDLYPHPSLFALSVVIFVILEIVIIFLADEGRLRNLLSYVWVIVPLFLILIFFLFARYSEGAVKTGGGLMKPTLFRFDFSNYIKLESEIEVSDDLVMLFRKEGPSQRILLRRFVLSGYSSGRGFYRSSEDEKNSAPVTVPDTKVIMKDPGYIDRVDVKQEFFFINFDPTSLIAMNYPVKVTPLVNWDSSSFLRIYRVKSRVTSVLPLELEDYKGYSGAELKYDTNYAGDEAIKIFAEKITENEPTYYGKVKAIESYLKNNYLYSLKPGIAEDGNQLHHFLFKSKKGYCSYFAFAMALMCRSLGIPARVAVGFFVNPHMEVLNFYEIRANQAHAWVEVYFGNLGWIEFDPTSETLAPGENLRFGLEFDFPKFAGLIEEILKNQDKLKEAEETSAQLKGDIASLGRSILEGMRFVARIWYLIIPLLYLIIISSIKLFPLAGFIAAKNLRKKVKYLYRYSLGLLYGAGKVQKGDETYLEYAERLEKEDIRILKWTYGYLNSVFSSEFESDDYADAVSSYHEMAGSFKSKYSVILRVLMFLNPLNSLKHRV